MSWIFFLFLLFHGFFFFVGEGKFLHPLKSVFRGKLEKAIVSVGKGGLCPQPGRQPPHLCRTQPLCCRMEAAQRGNGSFFRPLPGVTQSVKSDTRSLLNTGHAPRMSHVDGAGRIQRGCSEAPHRWLSVRGAQSPRQLCPAGEGQGPGEVATPGLQGDRGDGGSHQRPYPWEDAARWNEHARWA